MFARASRPPRLIMAYVSNRKAHENNAPFKISIQHLYALVERYKLTIKILVNLLGARTPKPMDRRFMKTAFDGGGRLRRSQWPLSYETPLKTRADPRTWQGSRVLYLDGGRPAPQWTAGAVITAPSTHPLHALRWTHHGPERRRVDPRSSGNQAVWNCGVSQGLLPSATNHTGEVGTAIAISAILLPIRPTTSSQTDSR